MHSEEEYDEDLQNQQYDQDEDPKDTELEKSREGGRATSAGDEEGEITDENREEHREVNSNNGGPPAVGPDPGLVDLAIEMMLAGQVNIPAKVYREYQRQKEVCLNCAVRQPVATRRIKTPTITFRHFAISQLASAHRRHIKNRNV